MTENSVNLAPISEVPVSGSFLAKPFSNTTSSNRTQKPAHVIVSNNLNGFVDDAGSLSAEGSGVWFCDLSPELLGLRINALKCDVPLPRS